MHFFNFIVKIENRDKKNFDHKKEEGKTLKQGLSFR